MRTLECTEEEEEDEEEDEEEEGVEEGEEVVVRAAGWGDGGSWA